MRSYGRIKGRRLRAGRAAALEGGMADARLDLSEGRLDPSAIMPEAEETWLELGFGGGEHLAAQAAAHPEVLALGAEPFVNGVASALRHVQDRGLGNVRIHPGDGRELLAALPAAAVARVFVLFPDPWPKSRHHKRRLITAETVDALARIMAPGAILRFATDWADYVGWTLERFSASPHFLWTAEQANDWRRSAPDHVSTRYEEKRLGDCSPVFLEFRRI